MMKTFAMKYKFAVAKGKMVAESIRFIDEPLVG